MLVDIITRIKELQLENLEIEKRKDFLDGTNLQLIGKYYLNLAKLKHFNSVEEI